MQIVQTFYSIFSKISLPFYFFLALVCIHLFRQTLRLSDKNRWDSVFFLWMCVGSFVASTCSFFISLYARYFPDAPRSPFLFAFMYASICFIPAYIYLHIIRQVSPRAISRRNTTIIFLMPIYFAVIIFLKYFFVIETNSLLWNCALTLYIIWLLILAFLCVGKLLSVFFEMPKHMRTPAKQMMLGTLLALAVVLPIVKYEQAQYIPVLSAIGIILLLFYLAMKSSAAGDVIITSNEFVLDRISTLILVLNPKYEILNWNQKEQQSGAFPRPLYKEHIDAFRKRVAAQTNGSFSGEENEILTCHLAPGQEENFLFSLRPASKDNKLLGYIVEIASISSVYKTIRTLTTTSFIDQLTGLYNRNGYIAKVEELTSANALPLLIIVGDINNLKPINDTCGHLAGDDLLIKVANTIQAHIPKHAVASRIGGDEYTILVPCCTEESAQMLIQKISQDLASQTAGNEDFSVPISVSWGYAVMREDDRVYNDVFSRADKMMYEEKKNKAKFRPAGLLPR